jgi:hypothetical protein
MEITQGEIIVRRIKDSMRSVSGLLRVHKERKSGCVFPATDQTKQVYSHLNTHITASYIIQVASIVSGPFGRYMFLLLQANKKFKSRECYA